MTANLILQGLSAASAFIAAGIWLYLSKIPVPQGIHIFTASALVPGPGGPPPVGGQVHAYGASSPLNDLAEALSRQGKLNGRAAIAAGIAAALQGIALLT